MIQANEIRRNNLIYYGNMIYPVDRITEQSISVRIGNQSLRTARPHEFEPVPLTPDVLVSCGAIGGFFKYTDQWIEIFMDQYHLHGRDSATTNQMFVGKIKYVHQLQNLYFALTGTELSVNLDKVKV